MQETSGTSVSDVVDSAKQKTQEQVGEVAEKGRGVVRDQVDRRSTQAGEQAQSLAGTLRETAAQLRESGDDQKQRYAAGAEQGADRLDRLGGYLTDADGDEILWRVEDVARRQPLLVAGAGLLLGIAFARVLKASSSERAKQSRMVNRNGRGGEAWRSPSLPAATASTPSFPSEGG